MYICIIIILLLLLFIYFEMLKMQYAAPLLDRLYVVCC